MGYTILHLDEAGDYGWQWGNGDPYIDEDNFDVDPNAAPGTKNYCIWTDTPTSTTKKSLIPVLILFAAFCGSTLLAPLFPLEFILWWYYETAKKKAASIVGSSETEMAKKSNKVAPMTDSDAINDDLEAPTKVKRKRTKTRK